MEKSLHDFGYCVWFLPTAGHPWFDYADGFSPHLTIAFGLGEKESKHCFNDIQARDIEIRVQGELKQTCVGNFHALSYDVEPIGTDTPTWWPTNPHVSFRYRYDRGFTREELSKVKKQIKVTTVWLSQMRIVICMGHFTGWNALVGKV